MFGESESESPRVPSPWDHLISSRSPSGSPPSFSSSPKHSTNNTNPYLPRLVPEAESGNVEYKLQLLSPSPARFARLVTQLKWRLLEGGGQAYYELGVADSGALVGLCRPEMEASLETLEMMAGEIGASVVVVKEVEVPREMVVAVRAQQEAGVDLNWVGEEKWGRVRTRKGEGGEMEGDETTTTTTSTTTDAETEEEREGEDLSATVMLHRPTTLNTGSRSHSHSHSSGSVPVFSMDLEPEVDPADNADGEQEPPETVTESITVIDLEISSVFKPRPVRTKMHSAHLMNPAGRSKRQKKMFKSPFKQVQGEKKQKKKGSEEEEEEGSGQVLDGGKRRSHRRQGQERTQRAAVGQSVGGTNEATTESSNSRTDELVSGLESLHVSVEMGEDMPSAGMFIVPAPVVVPVAAPDCEGEGEDHGEDDDVFPPAPPARGGEKEAMGITEIEGKRIILEALVVRKMSLEEAFLDFGVFAN